MTPETLASFVVLGRVDDRPTDVIGRPIESRTAMTPDEFEAVVTQLEARYESVAEYDAGGEGQ